MNPGSSVASPRSITSAFEGIVALAPTPVIFPPDTMTTPGDVTPLLFPSNMRAASFVESTAKTGTDKPALTVTVKYEDGKREEKVTFGQSGSDVFALRSGEPGAAKADSTDFNDVIKTLDEISK